MDKNNIFEHIVYEMQMYLFTLGKIKQPLQMGAFETNIIIDSHLLHLRSLLDFFNNGLDCINVNFLLIEQNNSFQVPNHNNENKRIINKSCNHLTKERFEDSLITKKQTNLISEMLGIVPNRIKEWCNYMLTTDKLKPGYQLMFEQYKNSIFGLINMANEI